MTLKRRPLRHQIKDVIMERIISGDLRPGERLGEMRIAAELGTSQAPVREALRELEAIGFVSTEPNRGTFVRNFWQQGLREFYLVRGALEESATRAATPMPEPDLRALDAEIDAMRLAANRDDIDGVAEHSIAFHAIIVRAARNELLLSVWQSLQIESRTTVTLLSPGVDLVEIAESHQPIVDSIRSGDVESACRAARAHQRDFERFPALLALKGEVPKNPRDKAAKTKVKAKRPAPRSIGSHGRRT